MRPMGAGPGIVRGGVLPLVTVLAGLLGACSGEEQSAPPSSTRDEPFEIVHQDDGEYVVGHGITMRMPRGWTDYEPEQDSADGTSYEWAVGLPATTRPLPAGVQFSMGKDGRGVPFEELPDVTLEHAELEPGYRLVDAGEVAVPGAEAAEFLRIEKDLELDGRTVKVEQLQLMLRMPGGQSSVVRFIAEDGRWEEQMQAAYDSLAVEEETVDE